MKAATFIFVCSIFCVIFLSVIAQAQNSLTHNTGTLEVTFIENGYIGNDLTGNYGGVVFNGNPNAMFSAGDIFGQFGLGYGNYYGLLVDLFNVIPITGFFSDPFFNEIAYHTVAFTGNPDSRILVKTLSNTGHDFVFLRANISNNAITLDDVYPGIFADWDVNNAINNRGGYDPSRNLLYMYDNGGGTDGSYYGIMGIAIDGISMAPNTMKGTIPKLETIPSDSLRNYIYNYMTSTAFDTITTDGDYRMFISFGPFTIPAGSSLEVVLAIIAGTSLADLLSNADEAILYGQFVPVELTSFTANVKNEGSVVLNWSTATEINNKMFEIERRSAEGQYTTIGYVEGFGTTTEPQEYSYIDNTVESGTYFYRLKQIDFGGQFEYSDEIEVEVNGPLTFALEQNYPNPFNPSTLIKYSVPKNGFVKLSIYNLVGEEVSVLVNKTVDAGFYEVSFNATNLSSGTYFYRLQAGKTVQIKKMVLLK